MECDAFATWWSNSSVGTQTFMSWARVSIVDNGQWIDLWEARSVWWGQWDGGGCIELQGGLSAYEIRGQRSTTIVRAQTSEHTRPKIKTSEHMSRESMTIVICERQDQFGEVGEKVERVDWPSRESKGRRDTRAKVKDNSKGADKRACETEDQWW